MENTNGSSRPQSENIQELQHAWTLPKFAKALILQRKINVSQKHGGFQSQESQSTFFFHQQRVFDQSSVCAFTVPSCERDSKSELF